ncbi:MAG TPA: hypothetical protein VK141_01330 [Nitrosomonas sp.]|nr:hypothetical protein [Nitrosomonas sp.]
MKTAIYRTSIFLVFINSILSAQNQPLRAATANRNPDDYITSQPEFTAVELALPPVGEIQRIHLRLINSSKDGLAETLAVVPAGPDGQGSPWFTKAQTFKTGLDTVAASRLQTDCFSLIPQIAELLKTRQAAVPGFAAEASGLASGCSSVIINAIERHIIDQNGTVSAANLIRFSTVFSTPGFLSEGDWEASPIPVDSAGIMILDAPAVVTQLKTRPWQEADQFLGNNSATEAFARYAATGNGMTILKTKYAANQATIIAKWNELADWVVSQRPPN